MYTIRTLLTEDEVLEWAKVQPAYIHEAVRFATQKHGHQIDDEERPYILHPVFVGRIIMEVLADDLDHVIEQESKKDIIQAAFLHDVLEDTNTTHRELIEEFGQKVCDLVLELTHEGDKSRGFYFPRLKSKEAIIIKFVDRLHNLSRMHSWDMDRQEHYLRRSRFWKKEKDEKPW